MTEAYIKDQSEIKEDSSYNYIDAKETYEKVEEQKEKEMASIKVDENGVVEETEVVHQEEPTEVKQETEEDPFDFEI